MGKEERKDKGDNAYVLKVDMHCECTGCIKKITDGIKEVSLSEGVERADLVAETGEVKVVGTMNPERFCCLLHEVTKKYVRIVVQSNVCEGRIATPESEQGKNLFRQVPSSDSGWLAPEAGETLKHGWRNGVGKRILQPVTPSAPPLPPDDWSETVASERCWYRWPAPDSSTLPGVWAASDVTGTLAMYEL